ncbi:MAG: antitoxin Xre/MbcA/ParS toxin-binding domain-containing protein [Nitrospirota bacterium]
MQLTEIKKALGGEKVLRKKIKDRIDLIELSDKGLTKDALTHLANYLSLSLSQISKLLPITERTVLRYASNKHFNNFVSEHILQIAEVAIRGVEVFEDKDKFIKWMNHPSKALAKKTPLSLLKSRFGIAMVLDELGRIEHGIFA